VAGAPAVAWLTVVSESLRYLKSKPIEFSSSPGVFRSFCGRCGTPVTYRRTDLPGEIDITVTSLDEPGSMAPGDHTWMEDALPWDKPGSELPQYPQARVHGP
jgi:hypothetical protein